MDPTNEEILRFMQEWLDITEHKLAARYDRMIQVIDSCLTTGCATTSSSTSVGNDVCGVAEVPTPAYSDSDVNLVTVDAADPADPTRTTHWTRDSSRDTTESRSAPAPTTAPTVHTATVDIIPVLTAAAASDGTFGGQAISGVASTLATCSMVCLHQHQVTDPALVATSLPTPAEFVLDTNDDTSSLDTNGIPATAVPLAIAGVLPAVSEMVISALTVQAQQLYNSSELFRPGYSLHIINIVPVHRPIPWPSFTGVHADGNKAPAFKGINDCESSSDAIMKPSWRYTCDSFLQTIGNVVEFQIQGCYGNLCTSTSSITIRDMCSASELKCWNDVLLFFEYWWSIGNYVQSVHTTLVGPPCFIPGSPLWVIIRSFKLKLFSNGYAPITLLVVLLDSGTFAAFGCEYFWVDNIGCIGSWLIAGCLLAVCWKNSVQSSTDSLIASENVSRLLITLNCSDLKELVVLNLVKKLVSSSEQLSCANQYTSCSPGYFVTSSQMDFVACSVLHRFLSGLSPSCRPVVMFDLQITKSGSHCVYLQDLQLDRSGIEGTLNSIRTNVNCCGLKWSDSNLAYSVDMVVYCSSLSCTCEGTICESILAPTIFSIPLRDVSHCLDHFVNIAQIQVTATCSTYRLFLSGYSINFPLARLLMREKERYGILLYASGMGQYCANISNSNDIFSGFHSFVKSTSRALMQHSSKGSYRELLLIQQGIHSWLDSTNMPYSDHAFLAHDCVLLCLLHERLQPPQLILRADCYWCNFVKDQWLYFLLCDIPAADSSCLTLCEVLLLHQEDMIHWQIAWQPCAHACLIRIELSPTHNECRCFLCEYQGRTALLLFLELDRQAVFQGGRHTLNSVICYLLVDTDIDFLDYMDSNGLKVLQVLGDPNVCDVALSAAFQEVQLHIPWDPGGSEILCSTTTAWGQAVFQGGRGVRVPTVAVPDQQAQVEAEDESMVNKQRPTRTVKPNPKYHGPAWQR